MTQLQLGNQSITYLDIYLNVSHFDLPIQFNKCWHICYRVILPYYFHDAHREITYDPSMQTTNNNSEMKNTYEQK